MGCWLIAVERKNQYASDKSEITASRWSYSIIYVKNPEIFFEKNVS